METRVKSPSKKMKARIPPKRGSIKAKIFRIFVKKSIVGNINSKVGMHPCIQEDKLSY